MRAQIVHHRAGAGRPTAVRVALVSAALLVLLVLLGVVLPVWTLIGSADATVAGALDVPGGRIAAVTVLGVLVVLALAVGLVLTVRPAVAWSLTALLVVVALLTALYPLLATAQSAVDQGQAFLPWITDLVIRLRG